MLSINGMRTTLDLDDDVISAARELAAAERRSLGAVISELVRRGLTTARVEIEDGLPVIRVPSGSLPSPRRWSTEPLTRVDAGGALLDVNALVALAWDSHIHHAAIRRWFATSSSAGWATCPVTERDFVRVSSNRIALPSALSSQEAREALARLRQAGAHRFLVDDVSMTDADVPETVGHRQATDAHLLTPARRRGVRLVTFDAGLATLADGRDVELLTDL